MIVCAYILTLKFLHLYIYMILYACPLRLSGKMLNMTKVNRYADHEGLVIKVCATMRKYPQGGSFALSSHFARESKKGKRKMRKCDGNKPDDDDEKYLN